MIERTRSDPRYPNLAPDPLGAVREKYIQKRMAFLEDARKSGKPIDSSEFDDDTHPTTVYRGGTREAQSRLLRQDQEAAQTKKRQDRATKQREWSYK